MREVGRLPRRVQGRQALEQAIQRLIIRTARYRQHRAKTASDTLWACRVVDELSALLDGSSSTTTAATTNQEAPRASPVTRYFRLRGGQVVINKGLRFKPVSSQIQPFGANGVTGKGE